jgi:hypothetical protein
MHVPLSKRYLGFEYNTNKGKRYSIRKSTYATLFPYKGCWNPDEFDFSPETCRMKKAIDTNNTNNYDNRFYKKFDRLFK